MGLIDLIGESNKIAGENGAPEHGGNATPEKELHVFPPANIHILKFQDIFQNTRIIRLEENYRSTQPVLDVANAVLAPSREAFAKHLFTTTKPGGDPVRVVRPMSVIGYDDAPHGHMEMYFENVRVPASQLIGGVEGVGFKTAMKVLDKGRLHIAAGRVTVRLGGEVKFPIQQDTAPIAAGHIGKNLRCPAAKFR